MPPVRGRRRGGGRWGIFRARMPALVALDTPFRAGEEVWCTFKGKEFKALIKSVMKYKDAKQRRLVWGPKKTDSPKKANDESKMLTEEVDENETIYSVHYEGWKRSWDEWVLEERLRKFENQGEDQGKKRGRKRQASVGPRVDVVVEEEDKITQAESKTIENETFVVVNQPKVVVNQPKVVVKVDQTETVTTSENNNDIDVQEFQLVLASGSGACVSNALNTKKPEPEEPLRSRTRSSSCDVSLRFVEPVKPKRKKILTKRQSKGEQSEQTLPLVSENVPSLLENVKKEQTNNDSISIPSIKLETIDVDDVVNDDSKIEEAIKTLTAPETFNSRKLVQILARDALKVKRKTVGFVSLAFPLSIDDLLNEYVLWASNPEKANSNRQTAVCFVNGLRQLITNILPTQLLYDEERLAVTKLLNEFPNNGNILNVFGPIYLLRLLSQLDEFMEPLTRNLANEEKFIFTQEKDRMIKYLEEYQDTYFPQ